MMHAVMSKPILQRIVTHVSIVSDELVVKYLDEGWSIAVVDAAHVAMMSINVWSNVMDEYSVQVSSDTERETSIPIDKLAEALSIMPDGLKVEITDDEGIVKVDCGRMHRRIRKSGEYYEKKFPKFDLPCSIPLDTNEIYRMISKSSAISDHLTISCGPDGLSIIISSETDNVSYENDDESVRSPDGETHTSMFPLDYFVKALGGFRGPVIVELDTDYPMKMFSNDPFPSTDLLAPRIEENAVGGAS